MAFNEKESMVLSQLVYKNHEFPHNACVRLEDILKNYEGYLKESLGQDFDSVIEGLKHKVSGKGYTIVKNTNDNSTGFGAMAIADPSNEVTVVCRGTDGFSMDEESRKDVLHGDAGIAIGDGKTAQHKQMEKFVKDLQKEGYNGFSFTGHSLGGNLAMYGAIILSATGLVVSVKVFNAPQFNDWFCTTHQREIERIKDVTTQYQNEYDIVSSINGDNAFGDVVVVSTTDNDRNALDFDDHAIGSYRISGDELSVTGSKKTSADAGFRIGSHFVNYPFPMNLALTLGALIGGTAITGIIKALREWISNVFGGGQKYADANPQIVINTNLMVNYANSLDRLYCRAAELDRKMNKYYWQLGIEWNATMAIWNLGNMLTSNLLLKSAGRLTRCSSCLKETAADFNKVEDNLKRIS